MVLNDNQINDSTEINMLQSMIHLRKREFLFFFIDKILCIYTSDCYFHEQDKNQWNENIFTIKKESLIAMFKINLYNPFK